MSEEMVLLWESGSNLSSAEDERVNAWSTSLDRALGDGLRWSFYATRTYNCRACASPIIPGEYRYTDRDEYEANICLDCAYEMVASKVDAPPPEIVKTAEYWLERLERSCTTS